MKAEPKILKPVQDSPTPRAALETRRKTLQRTESDAVDGLAPIEPITGLDFIPNKITSSRPTPIEIKPTDGWVDRKYQRNLSRRSMQLLYNIITAWDWTKFKSPIVTRDDKGRYLVIDGQHTMIAAATHPDIKTIPAMFVPLGTVEEQAESFVGHNTARVPVTSLDLYHAMITSGSELHTTAQSVLQEYGIQVVRSTQQNSIEQPNQTASTGQILRILNKHGLAKFVTVVKFIGECGFTPIKADHWRFAEALLATQGRDSQVSPDMMVQVVKATNQIDALNEADRIAKTMGVAVYQGLLVFYKNRYNKTFRL